MKEFHIYSYAAQLDTGDILVDSRIMHFEILGEELDNLRRFYSELFGWKFERAPISEDYWLIQMAEDGNSRNTPIITGGLTRSESSKHGIIIYISVESIDESCEKIKELGGRILSQKREVFDMGWSILAEDPEGNTFAIWQNMD